jgi:nitrogen fixation protein NifU and related proteins
VSGPYTAALLEHFRRPRNFGSLDDPDASFEVLNPLCGDRIRMELAAAGGTITQVRFRGDACAICIAATSLLTEMIQGRPLEVATAVGRDEVLAALQAPIPDGRVRCALLPLEALRGAISALDAAAPIPPPPAP